MSQTSPSPYTDRALVRSYVESAPLKVPGLADLHRMTMLLLSERAPTKAEILVVGAGGGLETLALAQAMPEWRFTGVDPSPAMLDLARDTVAPVADRVTLVEGTVFDAPESSFDGAVSLLTLHHVDRAARLETLKGIHRRLHPGSRLVIANHSAVQPSPQKWLARSVAFGNRGELDHERATVLGAQLNARLDLISPDEEAAQLRDAGFSDVELFYAAFSFRGFVATAD